MDYRIVEKSAFTVVGKALRVSHKNGENQQRIPEFWQECHCDGTYDQLTVLAAQGEVLGDVTLGLCTDFAPNMEEFTYIIAAEGQKGTAPDGLIEKTIPANTWAIFEATGPMPEAIQTAWNCIWSEFFTANQFQHADGPDMELYPRGDPTLPDYRSEVWVPVTALE